MIEYEAHGLRQSIAGSRTSQITYYSVGFRCNEPKVDSEQEKNNKKNQGEKENKKKSERRLVELRKSACWNPVAHE